MDVVTIGEEAVYGILNIRVRVDRVDDFDVFARGQAIERHADPLKPRAETFAAVGGNQDQAFGGVEERPVDAAGKGSIGESIANVKNGIYAGVAGNVGSFGRHALAVEVGGGPGGGGEVDAGEASGENTIHLFREWLGHIPGPKAGFNVADGHPGVEGGQGAAEGCGRVALHNREVGFECGEDRFERGQHTR